MRVEAEILVRWGPGTSRSNISDGPSRMDCTEVRQLGSLEVKADWNFILESLL